MKTILINFFLSTSCIVFSINPEKQYITNPEYYNIYDYDTTIVYTQDKNSIFLYDISAGENNKDICLILAYGDTGNLSYYFWYAKKLNQLGFSVILFDYRGFGKSSCFKLDKNTLFYNEYSFDLMSVIEYSKKKYSSHKIGIFAFSMGTIITTFCMDKNLIDFVIAENYATNLKSTLNKLNENKNVNIILPDSINFDKYTTNLEFFNRPLLLFNSISDKAIEKNDYKIFMSNKSFELINYDNEHGHGYVTLKEQYFNYIVDFITKIGN
jgi:fermentation-respiration switch protein FrsA (DUF1100 family)